MTCNSQFLFLCKFILTVQCMLLLAFKLGIPVTSCAHILLIDPDKTKVLRVVMDSHLHFDEHM